MSFKHLEDKITEGNPRDIDAYLEVFSRLQEPTRTGLGYTLDIASLLDTQGSKNQYAFFGGYAVLSHLMRQFGEGIAVAWRGSVDVDMAGSKNVLNNLHAGYKIISDLASPNLPDKRTLKLTEDTEKEYKIDFYTGDISERFGEPEENEHFGIIARVASPMQLIRGKLATSDLETHHTYDILTMLEVLRRRGLTPEDIVGHFDGVERDLFAKKLTFGKVYFEPDRERLAILPPKDFALGVFKELRKRRNF